MINTIKQSDRTALQKALQVQPVLTGLSLAGETLNLGKRELLHAGPPYTDKSKLAIPVQNSAIAAILFEGWADSEEQAKQLLYSDAIVLTPAQDKNVAVPLADVLSPNMYVLHVSDLFNADLIAYSPINGGNGPVTRIGILNDDVVERLHWINGPIAQLLEKQLAGQSFDLLPIAKKAIVQGDDLHGKTISASKLLLAKVLKDLPQTDEVVFLEQNAAFFLNVWMAACVCTMSAAKAIQNSSFITAIGGNGTEFGIQIAALPGQWFAVAAQAPLIPDSSEENTKRALGAIGDSAVVDAMGFGAMLKHYAQDTASRLKDTAEQFHKALPEDLLETTAPLYEQLPYYKTGLTALRVATLKSGPVISLGVLDKEGVLGRLDGGFYFSATEPFEAAVQTINK